MAGTTTSRTYSGEASHNRLLGFSQTTSAGGNSASTSVTYQYNSAGDLLSDGLTRYHYDSEGRLDSATTGQGPDAPTTKYAHNALGQRVFKTEPLFSSAATPGTGKNLLADAEEGEVQEQQPGLIQQLLNFFSKLWSPSTSDAEKLGWSYVYAEDGSLLGEYGSGGSNSSGTAQYLYLPTASGPMPIAAVIKGQTYAIHSDHLNTPRRLTQADGQAAWQWAYSAFGEEQPTTGAKRFTSETTTPTAGATSIPEVTFNLRYPGQYFDSETKLHYNHFRSYSPGTGGRYTQGDPTGLDGGWNRFAYVGGDPLGSFDAMGLAPNQMCVAACTAGGAVVGGVVGEIVGGVVGGVIGGAGGSLVGPVGAGGGAAAGAAAGSQAGGAAGAAGGAAAGNAAGQAFCPEDNDDKPDCRKASKWDLLQAGILDPHAFKTENGAVPWSKYDICKCKDGSIRIAAVGQCGKTSDFFY